MNKHAALYIRVSTDAQYEEGYSVEAQKEKLAAYCKIKDIENYSFYIDGGWSGSNINRPEMERMIRDIKMHKINMVIVYKLDRLSRSQKDTVFLLEDIFIPNDCSFISLNENFDTATPYGKAMIGILSVFAQLERENIRERTRMGMYERVKAGYWMGGCRDPYGYTYDPESGILVPNEHAGDVQRIFDLYLKGYSPNRISHMFGLAGDTQVSSMLRRITYLGKIQYNGEVFQGKHVPLIDQKTFDLVQDEFERRDKVKTVTSQYLLTGLLYCKRCGAKMRYQKWTKTSTKIYCYSQQVSKKYLIKDPNCDNDKIDADVLEEIVLRNLFEQIKKITGSRDSSKPVSDSSTLYEFSAKEILQKQCAAVSSRIKRLYNLYAESDNDILLQTIKETEKELASLEAEMRKLEAEKKSPKKKKNILDDVANLESTWNTLSMKEKQQAMRLCIRKIEVDGSKISITYTF